MKTYHKWEDFPDPFTVSITQQECNPVGCVPSIAVAISGGRGLPWGCLPSRGCVCLEGCLARGCMCLQRGVYTPPLWTDTCKNITFPQLLLWAVIKLSSTESQTNTSYFLNFTDDTSRIDRRTASHFILCRSKTSKSVETVRIASRLDVDSFKLCIGF